MGYDRYVDMDLYEYRSVCMMGGVSIYVSHF